MSADKVAKLKAGHSPSKHSNTALIPSLDKPLVRAFLVTKSSEWHHPVGQASAIIWDRHQYSIYSEKHIPCHIL
ncbi:conserved hypothetical protein [Aeromonas salmonicida]|nr:conserved hypothetical protein [Aeromonas salmonicida]